MRVYGLDHLATCNTFFTGDDHARDHLGNILADEVTAQPFSAILVENDLHHTVAVARSGGFARSGERELADQYLAALF